MYASHTTFYGLMGNPFEHVFLTGIHHTLHAKVFVEVELYCTCLVYSRKDANGRSCWYINSAWSGRVFRLVFCCQLRQARTVEGARRGGGRGGEEREGACAVW